MSSIDIAIAVKPGTLTNVVADLIEQADEKHYFSDVTTLIIRNRDLADWETLLKAVEAVMPSEYQITMHGRDPLNPMFSTQGLLSNTGVAVQLGINRARFG